MATAITRPEHYTGAADVYRAIAEVQKAVSKSGIAKGRKNQQQGYSFRGIDDVYNSLSGLLAAADLCIVPRMSERHQEERTTQKGGTLFCVTVKGEFDFVSARDGSIHTATMYGEGMDSADKATNKAMSAAFKYCAMQVFCIPTEGMADADATTPPPVAPKPPATAKLQPVPPQPVVAAIEERPEYEYQEIPADESTLEAELRESIAQAQRRRPLTKRSPESSRLLCAFDALAARYSVIGMAHTYLQYLAFHGIEDAAGFPDNAEGIRNARDCYKRMLGDIRQREAKLEVKK